MMDARRNGTRRWARRPVRWPAKWRRTATQFKGEVLDMSEGGAFVCGSVPDVLSLGETVKLTIDVPGKHPVTTTAVVRWLGYSEANASHGIGVEFEHQAPALGRWADRDVQARERDMGPPPKLENLTIRPYEPDDEED